MVASSQVKRSRNSLVPTEGMEKRNVSVGTVPAETLRGVRCIRLSARTDEATSPERQREADDIAAASLGIEYGEGDQFREAVDLDVSASKIGPFDRPQLGEVKTIPKQRWYAPTLLEDIASHADRQAAELAAEFDQELIDKREAHIAGTG